MAHWNRREFFKASGAAGFTAFCSPLAETLPRKVVEGANQPFGRPNLLLFFPDQLRFDWIGGNAAHIPVQTPNLDRLADRGVRFRRAMVPSPLCAPSRACLASGKEYDRCGVASNAVDFPLSERTFYSLLRESGYHVMGCGKFDLHKPTLDWGLDGKHLIKQWGFSDGIDNAGKLDAIRSGDKAPHDPYMAYLYRRGLAAEHIADFARRSRIGVGGCPRYYSATFPTPLPENAYCDNWLANNGLELIKAAPRGKPWYLGVNFTGPHSPMDITRRMEKLVRGRHFPKPNGCEACSPETLELIRENYAAMVENIDRWVGIYMERLQERGDLDNTLVVFCSDHGDMLGDHNRWGKSLPYQPSVSVPLIISGPGVQRGIVSDAIVSTMDLTATFLNYAGLSRPSDMDSRSLRPVLEGRTRTHRQTVCSGLGLWRVVFDGRYKLIRGFDPDQGRVWRNRSDELRFVEPADAPVLLFDLENDPFENVNLASQASAEVQRLSELLWIARQEVAIV